MKTSNVHTGRLTTVIAILVAIMSITSSCTKSSMSNMYGSGGGGGGNGGPGANVVWIQGMAFTPSNITVAAGTTITWTNKDAITHTVTSDNGTFDSGNISSGSSFSYMFSTSGTYTYHCKIHPTMMGSVVVNAPTMGTGGY
jgi:plastocyanin